MDFGVSGEVWGVPKIPKIPPKIAPGAVGHVIDLLALEVAVVAVLECFVLGAFPTLPLPPPPLGASPGALGPRCFLPWGCGGIWGDFGDL